MASPAHVLRRLLAQGALLVVMVLLGAATGLLFGRSQPPTYDAQAYVVVTPLAQSSDTTAVNFAQAYGRIVTQEVVLAPAAATLGRGGSVAELRRQVRVSTSPDAPLIQLTGSAGTPTQAADLANAVSRALVDYGFRRRAQTRVRLDSFADAVPPSAPASPNVPLDTAVGAAAGLLLGGLAVMAGVGRRSAVPRQPEVAGSADYRAADLAMDQAPDRAADHAPRGTGDGGAYRAADPSADHAVDGAGDGGAYRAADRAEDRTPGRAANRAADRAGETAPVPRPRDGGRPDPRPTVDADKDGEAPAGAAGRRSPWDT